MLDAGVCTNFVWLVCSVRTKPVLRYQCRLCLRKGYQPVTNDNLNNSWTIPVIFVQISLSEYAIQRWFNIPLYVFNVLTLPWETPANNEHFTMTFITIVIAGFMRGPTRLPVPSVGFIMAALCSRCGHYILQLWCLCFFFRLLFSSPILSGRRLDLYHTSTHDVALMRMYTVFQQTSHLWHAVIFTYTVQLRQFLNQMLWRM